MTRQGVLVVVSGPSGAGKGTICKELLRRSANLQYSISATTRLPRVGETHGLNYWFVSPEQFQTMIREEDLLEWAEVYGNYYGTPRAYVTETLRRGMDVVLEIDTQGAMQIQKKFPDGVFIFIMPPSLDELAGRLYKRGTDTAEVIQTRLQCVCEELAVAPQYHYLVLNDQVPDAVDKVLAIITAEKCRVKRSQELIATICRTGTVE